MAALLKQLKVVQKELKTAEKAREELISAQQADHHYLSRDDLAGKIDQAVMNLARTSFGFADRMRRVIVRFDIIPVQDLQCGLVRPRARLAVRLANLKGVEPIDQPMGSLAGDLETTLNLFDPPVHIQHLEACLRVKKEEPRLSPKEIAGRLGIGHMTVKRAFDYARAMEREGTTDPYRVLDAKPEKASRWKPRKKSVPGPVEPVVPRMAESEVLRPVDPAAKANAEQSRLAN